MHSCRSELRYPLCLSSAPIHKLDVALRNLEEVTVRDMRGKLHIELEASISRNDCLSRSYFERVVNGKTSDGIYDFQKHP